MSDSLDEAFRALGDETRIRILRVLGAVDEPLSFSEILARVDVDDSGRFNYHLNELRGRYVEKTDDGYVSTRAGLRVTAAVVASAYAEGDVVGPEPADSPCPICGADRTVVYEDSVLNLRCSADDDHDWLSPLPPGATAGRDLEELVALGTTVNRHYGDLASSGTCPQCFGRMDVRMRSMDEVDADLGGHDYVFQATCESCGFPFGGGVGALVSRHPAVVSAYHEHGVDVRERTVLPHEFESPTVVSEDPLRLRVDVESPVEDSDDVLVSLVVDGDASVVDVTEH